jgi:hypothetical protein
MSGHAQLQMLTCPQCGKLGTLDLCTKMVPPPSDPLLLVGGRAMVAREVDALVCTAAPCHFYRLSSQVNGIAVGARRA